MDANASALGMSQSAAGVRSSALPAISPTTVPMTNSLLDLPPELIDYLIDTMTIDHPSQSTRSAFNALCLTCKDLLRVARPVLYSSVYLDRPNSHTTTSTRRLAHTLYTAPHLALLIRHISTAPASESTHKSRDMRRFIYRESTARQEELSGFEDALRSAVHGKAGSSAMEATIAQGYDFGVLQVDLLYVLFMARHARSVAIPTSGLFWPALGRDWSEVDITMPLRLLWSKQNLQHLPAGSLMNLRELSINAKEYMVSWANREAYDVFQPRGDVAMLSAVMELPALRRLCAKGFAAQRSPAVWPLSKASSTVRSLSLLQSKLTPTMLTTVIDTCATLEEFFYEMERTDAERWTEEDQIGGTLALHDALYQHRDTLHTLSITHLAIRDALWNQDPAEFPLHDLHNLTTVEIDMYLLLGIRRKTCFSDAARDIPCSLRDMTVHTDCLLEHLVIFVNELGTLQHRGLEKLQITFRNTAVMKYSRYTELRDTELNAPPAIPSSSKHRFRVGTGEIWGRLMLTFACWELQQWSVLEMNVLMSTVRSRGLNGLMELQRPDVWQLDCVLGEALLSARDAEELEWDTAAKAMLIDFGDTLVNLFGGEADGGV
ncbi:unnamed protein product [Zymoseptoria tritici ST99CH_3D1]|nr:unnamed protein product [Zymoseptoria tritici ST99CH_3D1]